MGLPVPGQDTWKRPSRRRQCGAVPLAGSCLCGCVVWRTHRGGPVARVYAERSAKTLGDLELVCNEAVQPRGRGRPGIPTLEYSE